MKHVAVLLALIGCAAPSSAEQMSGALTGSFGFYGERCDARGKGKGCVMTFEVTGEAAKALYDRITWKPQPDACTEGLVKDSRNGLRCFKVKNDYTCDFGYSFLQQSLTHSDMEC